MCVVIKGTKMLFYKDQKSYRSSPDNMYRGESPMELQGGTAEVASDYTKKRHVFRLKWVDNFTFFMSTWRVCLTFSRNFSGFPTAENLSSKLPTTMKWANGSNRLTQWLIRDPARGPEGPKHCQQVKDGRVTNPKNDPSLPWKRNSFFCSTLTKKRNKLWC